MNFNYHNYYVLNCTFRRKEMNCLVLHLFDSHHCGSRTLIKLFLLDIGKLFFYQDALCQHLLAKHRWIRYCPDNVSELGMFCNVFIRGNTANTWQVHHILLMYMRCVCEVFAGYLPCTCDVFANRLRCYCGVLRWRSSRCQFTDCSYSEVKSPEDFKYGIRFPLRFWLTNFFKTI